MLALSSNRFRDDATRLAAGIGAAHALGFRAVHAARPPEDPVPARRAAERLGIVIQGVAGAPVASAAGVRVETDRAAQPAALLKTRVVVVDAGDLVPAPGSTPEAAIDLLARALFDALAAWPGLQVALRPAGRHGRLVGFRETEWLLDALAGKQIGLWLDVDRAVAGEREARAAKEAGVPVLDWADRYGRHILGVVLPSSPEGSAFDPGEFFHLVPSRAIRVLEPARSASDVQVVDSRRWYEEDLGQ